MTAHSAAITQSHTDRLQALTDVIHFLHARGWTPATSSNFSYRLPGEQNGFSVSISGLDKGSFTASDFVPVDFDGKVSDPALAHIRPSAETLLHSLVYRRYPQAQVVLHTHSVDGVVLSKLYEVKQGILLKDFEVLKGLEGTKTHEAQLWLPIFSNSQDMAALATEVEAVLPQREPVYGFLLAGHGLYTWGRTLAEAKRHVEVFEYLFEAILKLRSHGYSDYS